MIQFIPRGNDFSNINKINRKQIIYQAKTLNELSSNNTSSDLIDSTITGLFEFNYDTTIFTLGILISFIGSYNSLEMVQNIKYIDNKKTTIILLFLGSFSYSFISIWSPHFIFISAMKFTEIDIYLDIRLILFCLITAILCNISGFCISYLPFYDRTYNEYKNKILSKKIGSFANNKVLANNSKTLTFKSKLSRQLSNNLIKSRRKGSNVNDYKSNNNNSDRNHNHLSHNNKNMQHFNISNQNYDNSNVSLNGIDKIDIGNNLNNNQLYDRNDNYVNYDANNNHISHENHQVNSDDDKNFNWCPIPQYSTKDDFDFSKYFLTNRLTKKEIIYYIIGGLIIGISILIIHYLSIMAIKINGEIKFNVTVQIILSIITLGGSYFLHFGFYYKNKFWLKAALASGITFFVTLMHSVSVKYIEFKKVQFAIKDLSAYNNTKSQNNSWNNNNNYSASNFTSLNDYNLTDTNGLIKAEHCFKIIVFIMIMLPYLFKEFLHYKLKYSNKIIKFIKDYIKLGYKELAIVLEFCDALKPQKLIERNHPNRDEFENNNNNNFNPSQGIEIHHEAGENEENKANNEIENENKQHEIHSNNIGSISNKYAGQNKSQYDKVSNSNIVGGKNININSSNRNISSVEKSVGMPRNITNSKNEQLKEMTVDIK